MEWGGGIVQFYYGQQMPLRILDECEFWKLQEKEHTVVIRKALDNLEEDYVNSLESWEETLSRTHGTVISYIESVNRSGGVYGNLYQQILHLVQFCFDQSNQFIALCRDIKNNSRAAKDNMFAKTLLDHIVRESEYFTGIARAILYNKP